MWLKQKSLRFKITAVALFVSIILVPPLWLTCRHFDAAIRFKVAQQLADNLFELLEPDILHLIRQSDRHTLSNRIRPVMDTFQIRTITIIDEEGRIRFHTSGTADSAFWSVQSVRRRNLPRSNRYCIVDSNEGSFLEFVAPLQPLSNGALYFVMALPLKSGALSFTNHSRTTGLMGIGFIILILILSFAVSKRAVNTIQRLGRHIQDFSKRTLKEPSAFVKISEIRELENVLEETSSGVEAKISKMARDIRARDKTIAELMVIRETYQSFCENAVEGIFRIKKGGEFLYANPALAAMLGYDSPASLPKTVPELFRACGADESELTRFIKAMRDKDSVMGYEIKVKRKDLSEIWVAVTARTVYQDSGDLYFYEGSVVDITDHVQADALREAKIIAEEANRAKNEFIARMSHEIRTPMNAVIGFSKLALKSGLTGRQYEYVEKVASSAAVLLDLINDILDFSRIESGKLTLEFETFELTTVMNDLIDRYGARAAEKNIDLIVSVGHDVPDRLIGDAKRLFQILSKLVDNAVKFTEKGEIVIDVKADGIRSDRVHSEFSVKDTGIGVSEEHLPNLFCRFTQGDTSTTRQYGGAGLGLSICKQLVELMDGTIRASGEIGRGSEFTFSISLSVPEESDSRPGYLPEAFQKKSGLLLVRRDSLAKSLKNMLTPYVAKVAVIQDFADVDEGLADQPLDFVVADHHFNTQGVYDRIETARRLNPVSPMYLVLILEPDESIALHSYKRDTVFVRKPVKSTDFYNRIQKAFGHADLGSSLSAVLPEALDCSKLSGKNILLVEDNPINQQIAVDLLEGLGLSVTAADNGRQSLDLIGRGDFHAVLMDIQMPEMDGLEAAGRMRNMNVDIPIIALTAYTSKSDRDACIQAGMDDHLPKPVNPESLARMLLKWIAKSGLGRSEYSGPVPLEPSVPKDPSADTESLPTVDFDAALKRLRGNQKLLLNILRQFRESYSESAENIRRSVNSRDMASAQATIHAVKGVSGNMMAMGLHYVSRNLDLAIKENSPAEVLDILIKDYQQCLKNVLEAIDQFESEYSDTIPESEEIPRDSDQPSPPVDIARITAALSQLLKQNSLSAAEYIDQLKSRLQNSPVREEIVALADCFDRFDFKGAHKSLEAIAEKMGVSLE